MRPTLLSTFVPREDGSGDVMAISPWRAVKLAAALLYGAALASVFWRRSVSVGGFGAVVLVASRRWLQLTVDASLPLWTPHSDGCYRVNRPLLSPSPPASLSGVGRGEG